MCDAQVVLMFAFLLECATHHERFVEYAHAAMAITREECRQETLNQSHWPRPKNNSHMQNTRQQHHHYH